MRAGLRSLPIFLALAGCNMDPSGGEREARNGDRHDVQVAHAPKAEAHPFLAQDPMPGAVLEPALADDQLRPTMQLQVVLDRLGFTPGVVDDKLGLSTHNALAGFQESRGLPVSGELDAATRQALLPWNNIPATRVVTIPADFAAGPFAPVPAKPEDQAKMPSLGYQSLDEKLAERFHTTPETLLMLNPGSDEGASTSSASPVNESGTSRYHAGQLLRVPNVSADRIEEESVADMHWRDTLAMLGVGSAQPQVSRIVVSKSKGTLRAYDGSGKLVALYTATMGSSHDPLPLGQWKVVGIARNPDFSFNPALLWDVPKSEAKQRLPPGPNGPVGVAWIDLDKPHYGIHGTPEPSSIGRAESHGCVRLTNWDVARLVQMVKVGTQVLFEA